MTLEEYVLAVTERTWLYPAERLGQMMYNTLAELSPELAEEVGGSSIDPFYDDERVPVFVDWLYAKLTQPESFVEMARRIWPVDGDETTGDGEQV